MKGWLAQKLAVLFLEEMEGILLGKGSGALIAGLKPSFLLLGVLKSLHVSVPLTLHFVLC